MKIKLLIGLAAGALLTAGAVQAQDLSGDAREPGATIWQITHPQVTPPVNLVAMGDAHRNKPTSSETTLELPTTSANGAGVNANTNMSLGSPVTIGPDKLKKPSSCPECDASRIHPPRYHIPGDL